LSAIDRQRHRQAARNENECVGCAQCHFTESATLREGGWILRSIHGVAGKQPPKEHDFGDEEDPHAERGGIMLLCEVFELVRERRRCLRHTFSRRRTRTPPRSRLATPRNSPSAGATAS